MRLEDGAVLAIHGQQPAAARCAARSVTSGAGHDQRFLVGDGDGLAGFQGGPGAGQPGGADDGGNDHVHLGIGDHLRRRRRGRAATGSRAGSRAGVESAGGVGVGDGDPARPVLPAWRRSIRRWNGR